MDAQPPGHFAEVGGGVGFSVVVLFAIVAVVVLHTNLAVYAISHFLSFQRPVLL